MDLQRRQLDTAFASRALFRLTMFTRSAGYYDVVYSFKDYATEAEKVRLAIQQAVAQL